MASKSKNKMRFSSSQSTDLRPSFSADYDDEFQEPSSHSLPLTQIPSLPIPKICKDSPKIPKSFSSLQPLKLSNSAIRPLKKPKKQSILVAGKENSMRSNRPPAGSESSLLESNDTLYSDSGVETASYFVTDGDNAAPSKDTHNGQQVFVSDAIDSGLDCIESTIDCTYRYEADDITHVHEPVNFGDFDSEGRPNTSTVKMTLKLKGGYLSNSIESRLLKSRMNCSPSVCASDECLEECKSEEFEPGTQLDLLLKLCSETDEKDDKSNIGGEYDPFDGLIYCPLCGVDISDLSDELRQVHTNECLDKEETPDNAKLPDDDVRPRCPGQVLDGSPVRSPRQAVDVSPVLGWLDTLGLAKYDEVFVREEIDWDTLQWLTEEDLFSMGVTALGPRKKIIHALSELRKEGTKAVERDASKVVDEPGKLAANKLITDYFPGSVPEREKGCSTSRGQNEAKKSDADSGRRRVAVRNHVRIGKLRDIPLWCCIPGTPFRVDAFKYLRRDCSHWFLTHFHIDHYQGLTRSFCHGKIYCSSITARLVNLKIGIPWDKLQILPLNQKISIAGVNVTCFDANHCPGSIILLFEPLNGKVRSELTHHTNLYLNFGVTLQSFLNLMLGFFPHLGCSTHGGFSF
ncbi:unnamed protein product [Ilex paraguariensis]|uniref:SAM domain-containing protein n=1 Tax=Ilex paraguariensis TaxID=185542 RepID=A0ABC8TSZ7_9AQUA